jgi:hypothetical protein
MQDSTQVWGFTTDSLGYVYAGSTDGVSRTVLPLPPIVPVSVNENWNMISVPIQTIGATPVSLFPSAVSKAFAFDHGYHERDTLEAGVGYWMKFSSAGNMYLDGMPLAIDTFSVTMGWNMVGSIGYPVDVSTIGSIPPGIVTSSFYQFAGLYQATGSLLPGKGYWVKVSEPGQLILNSSGVAPVKERIRIEDQSSPPPFDPE